MDRSEIKTHIQACLDVEALKVLQSALVPSRAKALTDRARWLLATDATKWSESDLLLILALVQRYVEWTRPSFAKADLEALWMAGGLAA